jgi:bacillithiol biosynthesis deacetylase BshB1
MKSNPKKIDILAFGAHPDDVELGCGATLFKLAKQGYTTGIIDMTEGELGSRGTVKERYEESAKAAKILKISFRENLKIPDGNIDLTKENKDKVIEIIRGTTPSIVFVPYPNDRHPDHIYSGKLVTEAAFYAGLPKIVSNLPKHRPHRIVYYPTTYEFEPTFVVDVSKEFEIKLKALQAYQSQFYNPDWPGENTFVSSQWFMEAVEFRARHYGWKSGVKYGEPFLIRESLALDDIVPILKKSIM